MQEATAVKLWRNVQWVSSKALAPGLRSLKWLLRWGRQGGYAPAGSAEDTTGTRAVKPWGFTTGCYGENLVGGTDAYAGRRSDRGVKLMSVNHEFLTIRDTDFVENARQMVSNRTARNG